LKQIALSGSEQYTPNPANIALDLPAPVPQTGPTIKICQDDPGQSVRPGPDKALLSNLALLAINEVPQHPILSRKQQRVEKLDFCKIGMFARQSIC
tara:strand:+ start:46470 stop:46757 length:288 start_codon:yes stop_codon:yes gene_type:complete